MFVRWSSQTVEEDAQGRLPGYKESVIRRFDAPEALDTRFHEGHTKSALNRVPNASRVAFGWTVYPYRGCSHACSYCAAGETPGLMGDGSTRCLEDLRPGDEIYGTEGRGRHRRYARTLVLDHWSSIKRAYRVSLADGTELVASGDHRLLAAGGWKHVIGAEQGRGRRPHLTIGSRLMGTGRFAQPPVFSADYRRGYLTGLIRGDATLAVRIHDRPHGSRWTHPSFRLALAEQAALERSQLFLSQAGVEAREFSFAAAAGNRRPIGAIRTQ